MKTFKVNVTWEQTGIMFVTAKNKKEARKKIEQEHYDDILCETRVSGFSLTGELEEDDN